MAAQYTYEQIANDYRLRGQYVDPNAEMTEAEFDALDTDEKIRLQIEAFGNE